MQKLFESWNRFLKEEASPEELYADFLQTYPSVKEDWSDLVVRPNKVSQFGRIDGQHLQVVGDALVDYFVPSNQHASDEQLEAISLAYNAIDGAVTEHYTTARDTALGNAESESDAEVIAMEIFKELFNDVLTQTSNIENLNPR